MGCDVHAVWQARRNDQWVDVHSEWDQDRHYLLFNWLAGVRGDGPSIAEPRGLPDDFTMRGDLHPTTEDALDDDEKSFQQDDPDYPSKWMGDHTYSWLTVDEILSAEKPAPNFKSVDYFVDEVRRMKDLHGDVRIVFGFDS